MLHGVRELAALGVIHKPPNVIQLGGQGGDLGVLGVAFLNRPNQVPAPAFARVVAFAVGDMPWVHNAVAVLAIPLTHGLSSPQPLVLAHPLFISFKILNIRFSRRKSSSRSTYMLHLRMNDSFFICLF